MKPLQHIDELITRAKGLDPLPMAVVHPVSTAAIEAISETVAAGLITPLLVGPIIKMKKAADDAKVDTSKWECIDADHSHAAADIACGLAASGKVRAMMKGSLHTDELLHAVLEQPKVRSDRRLSHVYFFEDPQYHKPFMLTDGVVNIAPTLAHKADIARNAIDLFRLLSGGGAPAKVAALAAVETVNADMAATIDAAALAKMADRGQLGECILDGPLAFDNAISAHAAQEKGIRSPVAGDPDILIVPNLEAGNMLAKQLTFLGDAESAGIVLGARLPIALTSRADDTRTRILSCALAVLMDASKRGAVP